MNKNEVAETAPTLSIEQLQAMLPTMKENRAVSISADMLSMEPGEEERCIFIGMSEVQKFNQEQGLTEAVELLTKDGMKKSADKVLVSTLRGKKAPMAILIVCKGWEVGKKGKYRDFDIFPLEAN